jgi:hypothetical protein
LNGLSRNRSGGSAAVVRQRQHAADKLSSTTGPGTDIRLGLLKTTKEPGMSELSRDEVVAAIHPINDATVAEIIGTGATHEELVRACHIFAKDRKSKTRHEIPEGRVGRVVSILERVDAEVRETWLGEFGSTLR